ncbi:hypothetical protein C8R44DRAFT_727014 [Mycena epipterygia]|nr:hypothetical protein C8R44DRAFT_727014 [Mycena epipterygia]
MSTFMYLLATAYWAYSVGDVASRVQLAMEDPCNQLGNGTSRVTKLYSLFNAIVLVNYVLSDGIVVWRAWVICSRHHQKLLHIPILFLLLTAISVASTIGLRIASVINFEFGISSLFTRIINILQTSTLVFSLISNLSATGVIAATAWRYRQTIRAAFREHSKSDQILTLLLESGILYCVSALTTLVASLVRLPYGTLGDLYTPINVQIAGAYAPAVLLLVGNQSSFNETHFLGTIPPTGLAPPIQFATSGGHNRTVLSAMRFEISSGEEEEFQDGPATRPETVEIEPNAHTKDQLEPQARPVTEYSDDNLKHV